MPKIDIEETSKTPRILGDTDQGTLLIRGKSLPENARQFFKPTLQWLEKLNEKHPNQITIDIDLEYYNTSSSSILFRILDNLRQLGESVTMLITWHYEEDDIEMEEVGLDFQEIIGDIVVLKPKKPVDETVWVK
jgi:hypothetical protein